MSEQVPMWRRYLRFARPNAAADLDDEIAFHVNARIDEMVATGMTREEAERAALSRLGDLARFRAQTLRVDRQLEREKTMRDRFETVIADVTFALRQLRRSPALAIAAILCFALGIGVNSAIFSIVNGVLIRPLPFRDADRIVVINEGAPKMGPGMGRIAAAELMDYRELDGKIFQATAIYEPRMYTVRAPDGSLERVPGATVTGNFLRVLGREPMLGRVPETWLANAENPGATPGSTEIIVSYSYWRTHLGGDSAVIGTTVPIGTTTATVAAVMPPSVQFPIGGIGATPADIFVLYTLSPAVMNRRGDNYGTWAFGRLANGVSLEQASAAVSNVATNLPRRYPEFYRGPTERIVGNATPFREALVGPVRRPLLIMLGAVCLVLLIACLNVSSLLVARSVARQREIAVRRAIGASRSRLAQQFLTESLVLVGIGGLVGLVVGRYGAFLLARLDPNGSLTGYDIGLDWRVVVATVAVTGLTGIAFSILPGIAGRDDLQTELREASSAGGKGLSRSGLVVAEIAIALLLTVGAGLMLRSFLHLRSVDPGFVPDHLLTFRVSFPASRYPGHAGAMNGQRLLTQRLAALPGVKSVASATQVLTTDPWWTGFMPDPSLGPAPEKMPIASANIVQPGYFETMGIAIHAGRTFDASDVSGREQVAIIGESLAKQRYSGTSPLGKRIRQGGPDSPQPWRTIVGVVADIKESGLAGEAPPSFYMPAPQLDSGLAVGILRSQAYVLRTAADPRGMISAVRATVKDFDGLMPITEMGPVDEMLSSTIADRRFNMFLLAAFALVALSLAAVGIYGLIAYSVAQRTRELGIRIALGAVPGDVRMLVVREGAMIALAGILIGSAGAIAATRVMRSMLYQVNPLDPVTFAAVGSALAIVAVSASWIPALRASRVSPLIAMRGD